MKTAKIFGNRLSYAGNWFNNEIIVKEPANAGATVLNVEYIGPDGLQSGSIVRLMTPSGAEIKIKWDPTGVCKIVTGPLPMNIQMSDILKNWRAIKSKDDEDLVSKIELEYAIRSISSSLLSFIIPFSDKSEVITDLRLEFPSLLETDLVDAVLYETIDKTTGLIEEVDAIMNYNNFIHTTKVYGVINSGVIKYTITRLK